MSGRFCNRCSSRDCHHRDVVRLAESFCSIRDFNCGLRRDFSSSVEAEELAFPVLCLDHTIRVKSQSAADCQLKLSGFVYRTADDTERQRSGQINLRSIQVRRKMAGIGDDDCAIGCDVSSESG